MLNLNLKKLTRLAIVLGAIILIMGTVATIGAFADSGAADRGNPAVTAEDSGDGYIAEAGNDAADNTTGLKAIAAGIAIGLASWRRHRHGYFRRQGCRGHIQTA